MEENKGNSAKIIQFSKKLQKVTIVLISKNGAEYNDSFLKACEWPKLFQNYLQ